MFGYPSNKISLYNTISISMNKSQVYVNACLNNVWFLPEYGGNSYNSKYMVLYRHVSVALFKNQCIFLEGMFVDAFSPIIKKNRPVNFLMKLIETL